MPHLQPHAWSLEKLARTGVPDVDKAMDGSEHEEIPTERYSAWRATAIYGFVPFQSPASPFGDAS